MKYFILVVALFMSYGAHAVSASAQANAGSTANTASDSVANSRVVTSSGSVFEQKVIPDVSPPSIQSTVPCYATSSGGLATSTFGLSLGGGTIDEECRKDERIRLGIMSGDQKTIDLANKLLRKELNQYFDESGDKEETVSDDGFFQH